MTTTLQKQAWESLPYEMDMAALIPTGDSLASVDDVAGTPTGLTITNESISGTKVTFDIAGGTAGTTYKIEVRAILTSGYQIEDDGRLRVYD